MKKNNITHTEIDTFRHCVRDTLTLRETLTAINSLSGASMTLFVTDEEQRLIGTVTDGDIRRALVSGTDLSAPVWQAMHRNYLAIRQGDDARKVINQARKQGVTLLPVLDEDNRIERLIDLSHIKTILPVDAVLMAGGKGERLRPLTLTCPKPLLKVGGKYIIDYNVEELVSCGVRHITATVNYLHEMLEEHFSEPVAGVKVECMLEPKRLGTLGSLSLIKEFHNDDILVMNSDLLTTLDFERMYEHHHQSGAAMTVAAIPYNVSVPFAVLSTEGDRVKGLSEKPTFNYMANAGVYIIKRELVEKIEKGEYLDAPDFILTLIEQNRKVSYFLIDGIWIDIGSPSDYEYADSLMSRPGL